jgi:hypothetical protein
MKYSLVIFLLINKVVVFGQDSTSVKQTDSLRRAVVQYTPYYSQPLMTAGIYVQAVLDSNLYKFNQGISIYNFLRGRVPGLVISPYAVLSVPGFRSEYYGSQSATVLIDGVPFNSAIGGYLNMNAWEYSNITVSPSTNALAFLDLPNSGIISLTSKSGAGFKRPTVEFNSTPLAGWREVQPMGGSKTTNKDWYVNNSLAFMQDFGAVDVRVSYNALKPWLSPSQYLVEEPMSHNLNLNLGHRLSNKGDIRLITNGTLRTQNDDYLRESNTNTPFPVPADTGRIQSKLGFLNVNLTARYQLNNWVRLTAQVALSAQDSSYEWRNTAYGIRTTEKQNGQKRASLYFNANKTLKQNITLSGFAGIQHTSIDTKRAQTANSSSADLTEGFNRTYLSGGSSLTYKDFVSTTTLVKLPVKEGDYANYSASGAFVFSQLLNLPALSHGKVRATIGKNHFTDYSSYPFQRYNFSFLPGRTTPMVSFEWGTDIGLLQDRFQLNFSRYVDKWETGNALLSEFERKGVEVLAMYNLIQRSSSTLKTQVATAWTNGDDFRGSLLVDYSYKNIFISAMSERLSLRSTFSDQSFTRLRDVTIGISLQPGWLSRLNVNAVQASLSAKNFYDFGDKNINDFESTTYYFSKSCVGSLTIKF